jgi:hypothetical protein
MHGSDSGLYMMDGSEIHWKQFDQLFWGTLKDKVLTFSSCGVGNGIHELFEYHSTFCKAIIAPTKKIDWAQGLIAFSNLYFLALENKNIKRDLKLINSICRQGHITICR